MRWGWGRGGNYGGGGVNYQLVGLLVKVCVSNFSHSFDEILKEICYTWLTIKSRCAWWHIFGKVSPGGSRVMPLMQMIKPCDHDQFCFRPSRFPPLEAVGAIKITGWQNLASFLCFFSLQGLFYDSRYSKWCLCEQLSIWTISSNTFCFTERI